MNNFCPTCHASGDQPCIKGRAYSPIWAQGTPFPQGHDSRRTASKEEN